MEQGTWQVTIVRQERGTKREVSTTIGGFESREAAIESVEPFEAKASRGGNQPITIEPPDGNRLTILAMDFRATKVSREAGVALV